MSKQLNINVPYVTRVEGHGNIVVNYEKGVVEDIKLEVVEAPRFFEVMLKGRHITEAPHIAARICGICAEGHTNASLRACENTLGIKVSNQTQELRKIILHGETIQSHILHVCFLVLPDLLNVGSVIPLASTHPDAVGIALRLKKLGNDLVGLFAGRKIHPVGMVVNGFSKLPTVKDLKKAKQMLLDRKEDLLKLAEVYATFKLPDFTNETEYIALSKDDEFAYYDGTVTSSLGKKVEEIDYLDLIKERYEDHSTSKHAGGVSDHYMVGALARCNVNHKTLHPGAQKLAKDLGLTFPCHNTFHINTCQVIETVHCFFDAIDRLDKLIDAGIKQEDFRDYKTKAGRGVGATEVPRGILFHDYTCDDNGIIEKANCIIPTGQNYANMEDDMKKIVPLIIDKQSKEEITKTLEMVVRAYDPCISCSVHKLNVKFV